MPFLVAMRLHEPGSYTLKIFVLRRWKTKVRTVLKNDIDEVETFLRDIQEQMDKQFDISAFFEVLAGLSVGPMRSSASGTCTTDELDRVIKEFFSETTGSLPWKEHFVQVV